ncbi:MAG: ribosome recycling factor [Candidatus Eisenbacteria bacterium]|uniref:Ribosome-recycling factor n=1 Tax=Eiseniibacteriota bacterium TaxID=2212470 RepID=A0A948W5Y7_UNCEI|nr:ribosome recycling factor [Candidatus Eisenbacteria bacterium]MBU2690535.1 ribosome recycling factor [Candidatus Eisenbacteria bacterium]
MEETRKSAEERMKKSLESFRQDLMSVRTGRATPAILDGVRVDYYGSAVPLKQIASISAPEPRLLVVQPYDKTVLGDIEKAIQKADLGFNPSNDGQIIRIPIPPLTEERRQDLVRKVKKTSEEYKVSVRNIRRDAIEELRKKEKGKEISEDELRRGQTEIQKTTDNYIVQVDSLLTGKEKEILED